MSALLCSRALPFEAIGRPDRRRPGELRIPHRELLAAFVGQPIRQAWRDQVFPDEEVDEFSRFHADVLPAGDAA